jgi:hypothetical protein
MKNGFLFLSILFVSIPLLSLPKEITLEEFMDDYTKPAAKYLKNKKDQKYLEEILRVVPDLAPDKDKAEWKKIVDDHLSSGDLEGSCKSCHKVFKKEYQKTFSKRLILVPDAIAGYDKKLKEELKK